MKKFTNPTKFILVLLVVGVWGLLLVDIFGIQTAEAHGNVKWEYLFTVNGVTTEAMNSFGNSGWEAYAIWDGQVLLKRRR